MIAASFSSFSQEDDTTKSYFYDGIGARWRLIQVKVSYERKFQSLFSRSGSLLVLSETSELIGRTSFVKDMEDGKPLRQNDCDAMAVLHRLFMFECIRISIGSAKKLAFHLIDTKRTSITLSTFNLFHFLSESD